MTMACLSGIGHGKQIYRGLAAVLPDYQVKNKLCKVDKDVNNLGKSLRIHKLDTFKEVTRARTTEFTHMSAAQPSLCQTKPQDCKSALSIQ